MTFQSYKNSSYRYFNCHETGLISVLKLLYSVKGFKNIPRVFKIFVVILSTYRKFNSIFFSLFKVKKKFQVTKKKFNTKFSA